MDTRDRILEAALARLEQRGYDGAGVKEIARDADAALGSLYHFFPGGKQQLAAEAIALSDRRFALVLGAALESEVDAGLAVAACASALAADLGGCSFTAIALAVAGRAPAVEAAIAAAIANWQGIVTARLERSGVEDARALASTIIATLEGAALASRIAGTTEPLAIAGRHLAALVSL